MFDMLSSLRGSRTGRFTPRSTGYSSRVTKIAMSLRPVSRSLLRGAAHGALLAGLRRAATGAGLRCVAKYAARGALVGAVGGTLPLLITWGALGAELGFIVKTLGQSKLLSGRC